MYANIQISIKSGLAVNAIFGNLAAVGGTLLVLGGTEGLHRHQAAEYLLGHTGSTVHGLIPPVEKLVPGVNSSTG